MSAAKFNALRAITQAIRSGVDEQVTVALENAIDAFVSNKEAAETLKFLLANAREYSAYVVEQGKKPSDPVVVMRFLLRKGKHTASFIDALSNSEATEIAAAVAELVANLPENLKLARGPYGALLGGGMVFNDAMRVIYSVPAVQKWYYQKFLKECEIVVLPPARNPRIAVGQRP